MRPPGGVRRAGRPEQHEALAVDESSGVEITRPVGLDRAVECRAAAKPRCAIGRQERGGAVQRHTHHPLVLPVEELLDREDLHGRSPRKQEREVLGQLGHHVGELVVAERAVQRREDRPGVTLGGGQVDLRALGHAAEELVDVEALELEVDGDQLADHVVVVHHEDAAQAAGAELDGVKVGALGNAATFSFYPAKNLPCLGDGGAITTDNDDLAEHARLLRFHGSKDKSTFTDVGYNSRLDEMQAALLKAFSAMDDAEIAQLARAAMGGSNEDAEALAKVILRNSRTTEFRTRARSVLRQIRLDGRNGTASAG